MNKFSIPSKLASENLVYADLMGRICSKDFHCDRKGVSNNTFVYIKAGIFYIEQYEKKLKLTAGDCALIKISDPHNYYSDKVEVADCIWAHFKGFPVDKLIEKLAIHNKLPIVINDTSLETDILECHKIFFTEKEGQEYYLSSKLYELFIKMTAPFLIEIDKIKTYEQSNFYTEIENYINENIFNKISLKMLADFSHMDKFYFIKKFVHNFGKTPMQYVMSKKIEMASILLLQDISIKDISYQLCFSDQSHFNKVFKNFIGISPLTYKKNNIRGVK